MLRIAKHWKKQEIEAGFEYVIERERRQPWASGLRFEEGLNANNLIPRPTN
jgi:hypothetical protein